MKKCFGFLKRAVGCEHEEALDYLRAAVFFQHDDELALLLQAMRALSFLNDTVKKSSRVALSHDSAPARTARNQRAGQRLMRRRETKCAVPSTGSRRPDQACLWRIKKNQSGISALRSSNGIIRRLTLSSCAVAEGERLTSCAFSGSAGVWPMRSRGTSAASCAGLRRRGRGLVASCEGKGKVVGS